MAYTSIPGGLWFPNRWTTQTVPTIASSSLMSATTHKCGLVCHAPKAGNIRKILFRMGTGAGVASMNMRVETVNASGQPSGTLVNAGASGTFTPAANTDFSVTLGTDATVTRGQLIAVIITGGASAPNNRLATTNAVLNGNFPYLAYFSTAWSFFGDTPVMAFEYDDGSYAHVAGVWPVNAVNNATFNSGSTPDEKGIKFRFPFGCKIDALWFHADTDANFDLKLYDSDGSTVLETVTWDSDYREVTAAATSAVALTAERTLAANTWYRLTALPGASNISIVDYTVFSAAAREACQGGANIMGASRTDAGAWTDETTTMRLMGVRVSQIDFPSGGSAGPYAFAMAG